MTNTENKTPIVVITYYDNTYTKQSVTRLLCTFTLNIVEWLYERFAMNAKTHCTPEQL
jgi:hypothetical protein